ncbi:MAG: GTPase ObgE [Nitrospiraceae bacterium]|jgi:GTP-binding protein|uniref:GTPase ObgE n=1 Tax=Nitrospira cf. moscoviensis SBR1015 TaxID=96242 RepID=UPI000A0A8A0C|nr:GTPase ObgE [Nitrospira cf. moscoviensis SBR1015]MBY0246773.1 GTPase ObgE [Nitrospiraceae bacterium]OQW36120.1 MAG: GTPase ObgE [Nitrospira sp. SG-bin2]
MFVDEALITVRAGKGGDGICSFRREMFVPRGGPDGGDGGHGGSVVFAASTRLTTLLDLRYQKHYEAEDGRAGGASNCTGRTGKDTVVTLPVGTIVYDDQTGEVLADLVADGDTEIIARGGRGGRGNSNFATSTNRVPTKCTLGTAGEERSLRLELKLLADVGLVGFPNAGKSTLISVISSATPKIADYPFTTLTPHLGVVRWGSDRSFVVADIPGIIEGAHDGKGLGFQFLRHIERTAFLLHLIDVSEWAPDEPVISFEIMRQELAAYDEALSDRPFAVLATKIDISGACDRLTQLQTYCKRHKYTCLPVSSATREGLDDVITFVGSQVDRLRKTPCETRS